jgi:phosphoglycerol transferase MdoB-like AlkP superfamily enzyme
MQSEYMETVRPAVEPGSTRATFRLRRWVFGAWVAGCAAVAGIMLAREPLGWLQTRFLNERVTQFLGGVGYVLFDIEETARNYWRSARLDRVDPTPYREYLRTLAARRRCQPATPPVRKHVIYVQMESADGLLIGARRDGRPVMPFLESLAREQVWFSNVVDNTAGGRTTDAQVLVQTSQVPLRNSPVYVSQPLDRVPSLPKALKAAGYHTWLMSGYFGAFGHCRSAAEALGYDERLFSEEIDTSERLGWGVSDRSVLHQAAQRIIAAKQPTFAHVIVLTNHHPYSYVRESKGLPVEGIVADYVHSVRYMDECIATFFGELRAAGVLDNCIIAVFGDHDSSITARLERELQNMPVRVISDTVPLIIHGLPEAPRRIDAVAGLQDVPVIVLEALGLPVPLTFTGNGIEGGGRTVAAMYGPVEGTAQGLSPFPMPVDQETLTLLALHYPEKLLEK